MKILIVKLSAIGDVIHTLPALNAIRDHYPHAHITWLAEQAAQDIVIGHPSVDRVIVSKRKEWLKGLLTGKRAKNFCEIMSFIRQLKDTEYDLIFDFQALLKSGILIAMARGKKKIGFGKGMEHSECSYWFLNHKIPPVDMENHAITRSLMLLESSGIKHKTIEYRLRVQDKEHITIKNMLTAKGISGSGRLIVIHPIAKWKTKLWPQKKFSCLADQLIALHNADIVFTGSKSDILVIDEIISCMKYRAVNLAGQTTLKTLGALYRKADILITTDTGPMHLAAALGTRVVALFGPTAPWRTGPYGTDHQVVRAGLDCSPCFKRECASTECMTKISVKCVLEKVVTALSSLYNLKNGE